MKKISKGLLAATAVVALATGSTLAMSAPALAATTDVYSQTVKWSGFDTASGYISDNDFFDNALGLDGWTDDIFDGFFNIAADYNNSSVTTYTSFTQDSFTHDDGGVSTYVGSETQTIGGQDVTIDLTVTFDGNYVKYSFSVSTTGDANLVNVEVSGTSGANGGVCYDFIPSGGGYDGHGFLTTDLYDGSASDCDVTSSYPDADYNGDTIGAYYITDSSANDFNWTVTDGDDSIDLVVEGAVTFDLTVGLFDYTDQGGFYQAYTSAQALLPTLPDHFGEQYTAPGEDFTVSDVMYNGTTQNVPLVAGDLVDSTGYLNDGSVVPTTGTVTGLPAGVTATFEQDASTGDMTMVLSGAPTETGNFAPTIVLYHPSLVTSLSATVGDSPVYIPINLTAGVLPDTGLSASTATGAIAGGIGLLVIGTALLVLRKRRNA